MTVERPLLRVDPWLGRAAARGGMTTRVGFPEAANGEADERSRARSRELLARALDRPVDRLAWVRQVHGADVLDAGDGGFRGEADALVSDRADLVLLVSVADCAPVAVWDPKLPVSGIAHAGWRGAAGGVVENTVEAIVARGGRRDRLRAWIGPRIGPARFEVGDEVAARFHPDDVLAPDGTERAKPHVDLGAAIARSLAAVGVDGDRVRALADCTYDREDLYWSYRRDGGLCGRQLAFVARE